jgi:hypothetical protein
VLSIKTIIIPADFFYNYFKKFIKIDTAKTVSCQ